MARTRASNAILLALLTLASSFAHASEACPTRVPETAEARLLCEGQPAPWACVCVDRTHANALAATAIEKKADAQSEAEDRPGWLTCVALIVAAFGLGVGAGALAAR